MLHASVEQLGEHIRQAVDARADWQTQIRQAVEAYVGHIESTPALTLSWIRELPSLDAAARPSQRRNTQLLTSLLVDLSDTPAMRDADLPPLTQAKALILVGGLRELTAQAVEDGHSVRDIVEPAVQASIAMLGYRPTGFESRQPTESSRNSARPATKAKSTTWSRRSHWRRIAACRARWRR